jgi:hydrogenase nickel incorporation protein HypA/HybF
MHEYGLVEAVIARALEVARERGDASVTRVRVEVGEVAGVSRESLETAFEALRKGTPLADASLEIAEVPSRVRCETCCFEGTAADVDMEAMHESVPLLCPACGYPLLVTEGRGVTLTEVLLAVPGTEAGPGVDGG